VTTLQQVLTTIRQPVLTLAAATGVPVVIDNSPVPDYFVVWARVVTTVDSAATVQIGDRYRYQGAMTVDIYAPRGTGDATVNGTTDLVTLTYRGFRSSSPSVRVTRCSLVGAPVYGDGWSGRSIRVEWTAEVP
jgi:hypothetical protein